METKIEIITPEIAKSLVNNSTTKNRNINKTTVAFYAQQMKRGEWKLTAQGISLTNELNIVDGNHRLRAVVMAGVPIKFMVTYGVPEDTQDVYDTGKARNNYDVFTMAGVPDASYISAGITWYYKIKSNHKINNTSTLYSKDMLSKQNALNMYKSEPEFWEAINFLVYKCHMKLSLYQRSLLVGFVAHLIKDVKHVDNYVFDFIVKLHDMNDQTQQTKTLRDTLIRDALATKKIPTNIRYVFLIKCWNAYVLKKNIPFMRYSENYNESYPKII